jgi:hypothetical protein
VWYTSLAEQQQVELALQGAGALAPAAGGLAFYWAGLRVAGSWPSFRWQAPAGAGRPLLQPGAAGAYVHWGSLVPGPGREPDQGLGPELCAGANFTEVGPARWSSADCAQPAPAPGRRLLDAGTPAGGAPWALALAQQRPLGLKA